jgi:hypothetical protein
MSGFFFSVFGRRAPRWPVAERVERQARLMGEMMARLGVDPGAAARERRGAALAAASRACLLCGHSGECRQWLDAPGKTAPPFCPNASFFARLGRREGPRLVDLPGQRANA